MNQFLNKTYAEELFVTEVTTKTKTLLVNATEEAYEIINKLGKDNKIFNWAVGRDYLNFIKPLAVEFKIKEFIDEGKLNLDYRISPNAIDNFRHIELMTNKCIVTISQVPSTKSRPRNARFRSNLLLSNQLSIDFGEEYTYDIEPPYYMLLTHGYNKAKPDFINLGFPEAYTKGWIKRFDLYDLPRIVEIPIEEKITDDDLVKFKKHVEEML